MLLLSLRSLRVDAPPGAPNRVAGEEARHCSGAVRRPSLRCGGPRPSEHPHSHHEPRVRRALVGLRYRVAGKPFAAAPGHCRPALRENVGTAVTAVGKNRGVR